MKNELCVDASIVVKWFIFEDLREQSIALLDECDALGVRTIAPDHIYAEVSSTFRVLVYRKIISLESGQIALSMLKNAHIERFDTADLLSDAWRIASKYNLSTMYDAYYLALAELRGCDFWTADERFINSVPGLPYVRNIKDFTPGMLES